MFADRETVDKFEKMKVGTCLNPLHTALAVFGCILGYETIHDEMETPSLRSWYGSGVQGGHAGGFQPWYHEAEDFLNDVLTKRLPNPFMPDAPKGLPPIPLRRYPCASARPSRLILKPNLKLSDLTLIRWFSPVG
jgi:fructuronate reductase